MVERELESFAMARAAAFRGLLLAVPGKGGGMTAFAGYRVVDYGRDRIANKRRLKHSLPATSSGAIACRDSGWGLMRGEFYRT